MNLAEQISWSVAVLRRTCRDNSAKVFSSATYAPRWTKMMQRTEARFGARLATDEKLAYKLLAMMCLEVET